MRGEDLTGKIYGGLTVIQKGVIKNHDGTTRWLCECVCGTKKEIVKCNLVSGSTVSCGCFQKEARYTHRGRETPEYQLWLHMKQRCSDPNQKDYKRYGGRGITVSKDWLDFANFYKDVGIRPSPLHTLERVNGDVGYEKGNVIWATRLEQVRNRSNTIKLTLEGVEKTLAEWCEIYNVNYSTVYTRLKAGMDINENLFKAAA